MILSLHNLPDLASRTKPLEENPFDILQCIRGVKDDEAVVLEDSPKNKYSFMDDSILQAVMYVFLVLTAEVYLIALIS